MKKHFIRHTQTFPFLGAIAVCSLLLSSCAGETEKGSDSATNFVEAGYGGPFAEGQGQGPGDGDGDGGGAGIGAGGSLGAFQNATFSVYGAGDQSFGSVKVFSQSAVTIRPPEGYEGPLRVEISGTKETTYFDEALNAEVPTGEGVILRAVVPKLVTEIGVTPFTTAVADLLDRRIAAGIASVDNPADIEAATKAVADEVNRFLPSGRAVADIASLPSLVDGHRPVFKLPDTPAADYARALAAYATAAKSFNADLTEPALAFSRNLVKDLGDGRLDNLDVNGASIAPAADLAYDTARLQQDLTQAYVEIEKPRPLRDGRDPSEDVCLKSFKEHGRTYRLTSFTPSKNEEFRGAYCQYLGGSETKSSGPGLTTTYYFNSSINIWHVNIPGRSQEIGICSRGGGYIENDSVAGNGQYSVSSNERHLQIGYVQQYRSDSDPASADRNIAIAVLNRAIAEGVGDGCP